MLLIRLVLLRMYYLPPWFSLKFRFIITKLLQYFKYHFYYSRKDQKKKRKKKDLMQPIPRNSDITLKFYTEIT